MASQDSIIIRPDCVIEAQSLGADHRDGSAVVAWWFSEPCPTWEFRDEWRHARGVAAVTAGGSIVGQGGYRWQPGGYGERIDDIARAIRAAAGAVNHYQETDR